MVKGIQQYARSIYQFLANRRKFDRQPIQGAVSLNTRDRYGQITTQIGTCMDVSMSGIAVLCQEPLVPNADAYFHSEANSIQGFGLIRYCKPENGGYRVGLELKAEPEHWN